MKITRTQLRRIIREEKQRLEEEGMLGRGIDYVSKNILQNPDEWKDKPELKAVVQAAKSAKAAGVPVGVMCDFIKRHAK